MNEDLTLGPETQGLLDRISDRLHPDATRDALEAARTRLEASDLIFESDTEFVNEALLVALIHEQRASNLLLVIQLDLLLKDEESQT